MDRQTLFELGETTIGYGRALMRPLDLVVRRGDFWGLVGPNGAGKTTLVKTILGLLQPVEGRVGFPSGPLRFGYMPQRHLLNPDYPLTAHDVVMMGRTDRFPLGRGPSGDDRKRVQEEVEHVDMADLVDHSYASLSGGQQQRILLARALVADPDVLVLDEPTTGMDLPGEADILSFLNNLHSRTGLTILMIGHHIGKVIRVVDHLCLINQDTDLFEAGPVRRMLQAETLSKAYGRGIEVDRHGEDVLVHVQEVGQ